LISHSPCWKDTVIFVVEDDTQNGADHVDGHRSVFLAISPWVKKEYVSKTHASLASVFKTVNLILGLPPLNQYDAAATDLRDIFTATPDFSPYQAQSVQFARGANPTWLSLSKDIDFSRPDVDEVKLATAIMKSEHLPRPRDASNKQPIHCLEARSRSPSSSSRSSSTAVPRLMRFSRSADVHSRPDR
jgi:hypothetical protein